MRRVTNSFIAAFVVATTLFMGSPLVSAQEQQPEDSSKPKPAARAYPPVGYPDQEPDGTQDPTIPLQPDTSPLTGVQEASLGSPNFAHSYWVPGLQYHNVARSNTSGTSGWSSTSYITGNVSLYHAARSSQLSLNYSGGGYFSTQSIQGRGSGYFHQLGLTQAFKWRGWQLSLLDEFSYLPESSFGFGIGTGIAIPGIGGSLAAVQPGLQNGLVPNQSNLTSVGPRYSNFVTAQVAHALTRRSSINIAASYGILRFVDPGNIDSDEALLSAGYNYALSRRDTIGIVYRFTEYRFLGNPQALNDHAVHVAYGRKITGRLALRLFGGPELTTFRVPIGGESRRMVPSGGATLSYGLRATSLSLTYNHGVSGGSGIQVGATSDQVRTELDRQISRHWHGSIHFGYARNEGLGNSLSAIQNAQTFDSYYVGGGLGHPVGRSSNLLLTYSARIQNSTHSGCAVGTCSADFTQHQITLGFTWHARPFVLR